MIVMQRCGWILHLVSYLALLKCKRGFADISRKNSFELRVDKICYGDGTVIKTSRLLLRPSLESHVLIGKWHLKENNNLDLKNLALVECCAATYPYLSR